MPKVKSKQPPPPPSQEEIQDQLDLLASHRQTLSILLKQQAKLGEAYAPPGLANGIREARDHIKRIKTTLRDWGQRVADAPDDEEPRIGFTLRQLRIGGFILLGLFVH
jgi:hypothetical protein